MKILTANRHVLRFQAYVFVNSYLPGKGLSRSFCSVPTQNNYKLKKLNSSHEAPEGFTNLVPFSVVGLGLSIETRRADSNHFCHGSSLPPAQYKALGSEALKAQLRKSSHVWSPTIRILFGELMYEGFCCIGAYLGASYSCKLALEGTRTLAPAPPRPKKPPSQRLRYKRSAAKEVAAAPEYDWHQLQLWVP